MSSAISPRRARHTKCLSAVEGPLARIVLTALSTMVGSPSTAHVNCVSLYTLAAKATSATPLRLGIDTDNSAVTAHAVMVMDKIYMDGDGGEFNSQAQLFRVLPKYSASGSQGAAISPLFKFSFDKLAAIQSADGWSMVCKGELKLLALDEIVMVVLEEQERSSDEGSNTDMFEWCWLAQCQNQCYRLEGFLTGERISVSLKQDGGTTTYNLRSTPVIGCVKV